jgi:hypothetical protein
VIGEMWAQTKAFGAVSEFQPRNLNLMPPQAHLQLQLEMLLRLQALTAQNQAMVAPGGGFQRPHLTGQYQYQPQLLPQLLAPHQAYATMPFTQQYLYGQLHMAQQYTQQYAEVPTAMLNEGTAARPAEVMQVPSAFNVSGAFETNAEQAAGVTRAAPDASALAPARGAQQQRNPQPPQPPRHDRSMNRPPERPKQSLSAYNLFFRDARANMLGEDEAEETEGKRSLGKNESKRKVNKKRPLGFAEMARAISSKWKVADDETMAKFKTLALVEKGRYMEEMADFKEKQQEILEQSRAELEATVDEETKRNYFDSAPNP